MIGLRFEKTGIIFLNSHSLLTSYGTFKVVGDCGYVVAKPAIINKQKQAVNSEADMTLIFLLIYTDIITNSWRCISIYVVLPDNTQTSGSSTVKCPCEAGYYLRPQFELVRNRRLRHI